MKAPLLSSSLVSSSLVASSETPIPASGQEVLTSQAAVSLWLRFQCNPAETLHESYRELLEAEAKPHAQTRRQKGVKEDSEHDAVWLKHLWRTPALSRFIGERFSLRIDAYPRAPSDLSFFLRLVMLDSAVLLRLLRSTGLVLSAGLIAAVIESKQVARLRAGLGEEDYAFAMTKGARLRPSKKRMLLQIEREDHASVADAAFHTVVGLRLLVLQGEGLLTEQHWRRLALKCPRGLVGLLRRNSAQVSTQESAQEVENAAGLDEGTAAGLRTRLAVFEADGEEPSVQDLWSSVAKEVIGSWHAWLVSLKVA